MSCTTSRTLVASPGVVHGSYRPRLKPLPISPADTKVSRHCTAVLLHSLTIAGSHPTAFLSRPKACPCACRGTGRLISSLVMSRALCSLHCVYVCTAHLCTADRSVCYHASCRRDGWSCEIVKQLEKLQPAPGVPTARSCAGLRSLLARATELSLIHLLLPLMHEILQRLSSSQWDGPPQYTCASYGLSRRYKHSPPGNTQTQTGRRALCPLHMLPVSSMVTGK